MHKADLEGLGAYLRSRRDVVCAVVFGSARDGVVREGSDLDLGVCFTRKPQCEGLLRFLTQAAEAAGFDVIDLVDLRSAEPILAFEALSGRFICKNDPSETAAFTSLVCREYEDAMARLSEAA